MGNPYINPANAFDGLAATYASGKGVGAPITACRWQAWGAGAGAYAALTLLIDSEILTPTVSNTTAWLGYSTDSGITWSTIYSISGSNLVRPRTIDSVTLPPSTNLTKLQVRASMQTDAGTTSEHRVYEISASGVLQVGAAPVTLGLVNQSANICVAPPTDPQETAIGLYRRGGTLPSNWFKVGQFPVSSLVQGACGAGTLLINDNVPDSVAEIGSLLPLDNFQPVQSVQAVNFPLPIVFGPSDGRVLACGDPARPDAVYFSNRGNADLWGAEAWISVANPGEQIMNGLVYNLRTFAFSRERLYIMLPNIIQGITFVAAPTPCRRGLKGRWGFTEGEQGIYFYSKDGVYRTSGGPEQSIIDDSIRPLFPTREAPAGTPTNGYDSINMDDEDGLRMAFHNGEIWCYYTGATTGLRQLMIYDERRSRWRPGTYTPRMQTAYSEPNTDSSLLYGGVDGALYAAGGADDAGAVIPVDVTTGSMDQGRPLNLKEYLTLNIDIDPGGATAASPVVVTPRMNGETLADFSMNIVGAGRQRITLPLNDGWAFSEPGAFVYNPVLKSAYCKLPTPPSNFQGETAAMFNTPVGPDHFVEATIAAIGPATPNTISDFGIAARMSIDPATGLISAYLLFLRHDGGITFAFEVGIKPGQGFGAPTDFQRNVMPGTTDRFDVPYVIGDVLRIEAVSNQITGLLNGAIIFGPISGDLPGAPFGVKRLTAPNVGIEGYPATEPLVSRFQLSNFRCGSLPSSTILTPNMPVVGGEVYAYNVEFDVAWNAAAAIKPILYQYETLYRHEPAEVTHWELPRTGLEMQGWFHLRDIYVVLRSTADVTLTITPDVGGVQTFVLPNTYGRKTTRYVKLASSKSNSYAFALDSAKPFRVYQNECEVRVKQWLTKLGYQNMPLIGKEQIGSTDV